VPGLDTFICFWERTFDFGRKVVGNLNIVNVSKLVGGLTEKFIIMKLVDEEEAGKRTRHIDE
jgi:hypothetical protein